ncbi:bifunctional diguanylate cyclase/phosphodiesterase [Verticiella sediminum]|uniref:Bifunctional diguanylate cyclase/phosphodiesterase n=1 Tax=Verticiella sediminum TaxID=1247510 RepID=A0A556ABR6_9BURK|nr:bifunctional diguanylate cyclase/phosphodiesterase [Verticiella sediminum]TSH90334.1 bifunctional diguanylate cyclase/phosphodiesterase [Verticiella sediminum]
MNALLTALLCTTSAALGAVWTRYRAGRSCRDAPAQPSYPSGRDPLTGLLDHQGFLARSTQQLRQAPDRTHYAALIDLQGFKLLNRRYGRDTGDYVLMRIATRLLKSLPADALVARISGDEFAVLLPDGAPERTRRLLRRVISTLRAPYDTDADVITVQPRIGIARSPQDGADIDTLLNRADFALGVAKSRGGTRIVRFDTRRGPEDDQRQQLEIDLHGALCGGTQLSMRYQPICDCATRAVRGYEALMRWQHPVYGDVPPSVFVPIAERSGQIARLGNRALQLAAVDAARWTRPWYVSVNLSPRQFYDPRLLSCLADALHTSGLPASRLFLEVTEGVLVRDMRHARRVLREIQRLGARLALDDFGTGYSGLSYLHQLPFATVKIDRSFVQDLERDERARALVAGMIALCQRLDLTTLAEGVENERQRELLAAMGCTLIQGFLTGEPLTAEQVADSQPTD